MRRAPPVSARQQREPYRVVEFMVTINSNYTPRTTSEREDASLYMQEQVRSLLTPATIRQVLAGGFIRAGTRIHSIAAGATNFEVGPRQGRLHTHTPVRVVFSGPRLSFTGLGRRLKEIVDQIMRFPGVQGSYVFISFENTLWENYTLKDTDSDNQRYGDVFAPTENASRAQKRTPLIRR